MKKEEKSDMYEKTLKELLTFIPKRIIMLIVKLLSFKGLVWLTGTAMVLVGILGAGAWVTLSMAMVCGRSCDRLVAGTNLSALWGTKTH